MGKKKNIIVTSSKAKKKGDTLNVDITAKVIDSIEKVDVTVPFEKLVPNELDNYKTDEANTYDLRDITDPEELMKAYEAISEDDALVVADKPEPKEEKTDVQEASEELTEVLTEAKDFEDKVEKEPEKAAEIIEEKIEKVEKAIEKGKKIIKSRQHSFTNIWNGSSFDMDF